MCVCVYVCILGKCHPRILLRSVPATRESRVEQQQPSRPVEEVCGPYHQHYSYMVAAAALSAGKCVSEPGDFCFHAPWLHVWVSATLPGSMTYTPRSTTTPPNLAGEKLYDYSVRPLCAFFDTMEEGRGRAGSWEDVFLGR